MAKEWHINDYDRVLVVEGWSDRHFYAEALEHLGIHGKVYIQECGGESRLKQKLRTFLTPELLAEKRTVAVILDADSNATNQIKSIKARLLAMNGLKDRTFEESGWSKGQPNIGFFVVPNGHQTGEVETLAWNAWANDPNNAGPKQCIDDYLSCMAEKGHTAHSPDKGKISALLAVKYDEDSRLGPGARHNVFDFNRPEYEPLLTFLRGFSE